MRSLSGGRFPQYILSNSDICGKIPRFRSTLAIGPVHDLDRSSARRAPDESSTPSGRPIRDQDGAVDFRAADEMAEHRGPARRWVDANTEPAWIEEQHRTGVYETAELHRRMAQDGILAAGWPPEYGGSDVDPDFAGAVVEEIRSAGFHVDAWDTTLMVIHTIADVGSEEQKQRYIGGALRGDVLIALGYSEADAGSDMAAARTTAVRDGDEWIIDGEKMFTSGAQACSHIFVLARTDPDAPKHAGLSLLLVPTEADGYSWRPIHTLGGQTTTTTLYRDVRVDGTALIGGANNGWNVAGIALAYERGSGGRSPYDEPLADDLTDWAASSSRADGTRVLDDPLVAARIGRIRVDEEVARLLGHWSGWKAARGELSPSDGAIRKLFASEAVLHNSSAVLDVLGAEGLLAHGEPGAPLDGGWERAFRQATVKPIYGGSNEIMRDLIAQRHLGLPRTRP
ncbi:MAG TPA: acyl-CoA dehydrogenase family protein [Acidimicrobiales bacterium]